MKAQQNHMTTFRIDSTTQAILSDLAEKLDFNKSHIVRHSIRILKELTDIRRRYGEIRFVTNDGKEFIILLN